MNIENILNEKFETLLLVFFNSVPNENGNFEMQSTYKRSKYLELPNNSYELTKQELVNRYNLNFEIHGNTIKYEIKNNINIDFDSFLNQVYLQIIAKIPLLPVNYDIDSEIALAIFILRGSVDFSLQFYSVDLKNPTQLYIDNIFKILLSSDVLLSKLNLNFRDLQPQQVSREANRNTQIRINLRWFYENVIKKYSNINKYKTDILVNNSNKILFEKNYNSFEERLVFYKQKILGSTLTEQQIQSLRRELEFSVDDSENIEIKRNHKIIQSARELLEDKCVGCCDRYRIEDRTFKMRNTAHYYLEINHIVAFASDKTCVDVYDNLVKLCPACHRALSPNRAPEALQRQIIANMINSRDEIKQFIATLMPSGSGSQVDFVYERLR